MKCQIETRPTPGAAPCVVSTHSTLREAWTASAEYASRGDLTYQDVRIERTDGTLVEYAGPSR
jgi:hypothetical protein